MRQRPDPMPYPLRWRSNMFHAPLVLLVTGIFGTAALVASLWAKTGRTQHRLAQAWARVCVRVSGAHLTIAGSENLGKYPVAVYVANHTSYMDTPVIFATLPFQFRILAKRELWSMPFIGWYLARSGQIPVDTDNAQAAISSLSGGVKALRAGMPLFVFPEGSRTPDGELREFMAGAAYLALRAHVPVVPIALSGVYDLLPIHHGHLYPCNITMAVGEPIETTGMSVRGVDELNQLVRARIGEMLSDNQCDR